MLDARAIIAASEEKVGISDSEPHLHGALEALVAALLTDGRLSALGTDSAEKILELRTVSRLQGLKWFHDYPEIAQEKITAPVFLCGLPRSGTTYFQYLFDVDRRFRLIRTWETLMPDPPPGFEPASVVRRKAAELESRKAYAAQEIENFAALHLMDADGADECGAFLEQSYGAAGFQNVYDAPAYFDYLMDQVDFDATYQIHKRQLQLLQWRTPQPRWALKYPNHVIAMDAILRVYPDANFAMTHRDPLQTLASIAKMTFALRNARYEGPVDPRRVGRHMLYFVRKHIDRIMAFCTGPQAERVHHVDYYTLAADPVAQIEILHEKLGIDSPPDVQAAMAGWRRENPKNARGANNYALAQFGIRPEAALELFSDYIRYFDIPSEHEGLARIGALA